MILVLSDKVVLFVALLLKGEHSSLKTKKINS